MKALIISEDTTFIDTFDDFFSQKGFDTIIYRWLLKALDNIEEIRPNCVILSSSEYPRHWKTLVQFIKSGIGGDEIAIYLYEPDQMSNKDESKAKTLGITGYVTSFEKSQLKLLEENLNSFFDLSPALIKNTSVQNDTQAENEEAVISVDSIMSIQNEEEITKVSGTGFYILTNPETGNFVNGEYFDKNNKKITVRLTDNSITSLKINTYFENFTYSSNDSVTSTGAKIQDIININDEKFVIFELDE